MKAASLPIQRPAQAKLLVVDDHGNIRHWVRSKFVDLLSPGDLIVENDAATLPASLSRKEPAERAADRSAPCRPALTCARRSSRVLGSCFRRRRFPRAHRGSATAPPTSCW